MLYVCDYAFGLNAADLADARHGGKIRIFRKIFVRPSAERHAVKVDRVRVQSAVPQRPRVLRQHFAHSPISSLLNDEARSLLLGMESPPFEPTTPVGPS